MSDEDNESENIQNPSWDIMADHQGIKIDEKFVLKVLKGSKNVNKEVKDSCKVLHFSSVWNIEEVLAAIDGLDPKDYPQLLIFIIEVTDIKIKNFIPQKLSWLRFQCVEQNSFSKLQKKLLKFGGTRPMIFQLTSVDENLTNIYYKKKTSSQFTVIDQQQDKSDKSNAFASFLCSFLNVQINNSEIEFFDAVQGFKNRSLVYRFLQTLPLSDKFFGSLALNAASNGSKSEFLAALDSPFESEGRILSYRAQKFISDVFREDNDPENDDSVLLRAIKGKNKKVIDYLITYWTPLIQQLPFDHRVKISTAAFETNQLVLCDLLDIADYPFPKDFGKNLKSCTHKKLCKIVKKRAEFKEAIENENFAKIDEFINNNVNLKYVYDPYNVSALTKAINTKKFGVFYYLKSLGFQGEDCDKILQQLDKEEKMKAVEQATEQRKKSVKKALPNVHRSVHKLCMQSFIHNRKINKEQEAVCRQRIMKWFTDIHKITPEMLDVAASCSNLKIVFDFESESVEAIELGSPSSLGITRPISKWIFVGAKQSDKKREQEIKGVIAHELCHYVMCLVYNNNFLPYFKDSNNLRDKFDIIVKAIDKWSQTMSNDPDDECNGIISGVFTNYAEKQFHYELIVRTVQLLALFDDDGKKSDDLQEKYKILFEFWSNQVIPELQRYLQKKLEIIELNGILDFLPCITKRKYELCNGKDMENMMNKNVVIVQSNVPKLLFLNILKYLKEKYRNLFDSQNIFTEPVRLLNQQIWDNFKQICSDTQELRIFVDCSKQIPDYLGEIFINKNPSFIFVVSTDEQTKKLSEIFIKKAIESDVKMEINYNWNDLTEDSQHLLLKTKINFQNNAQVSLMDLLKTNVSADEPSTSRSVEINKTECDEDLREVINDQLLNLVLENQKVSINTKDEKDENSEKYFQLLFIQRNFIKKTKENDKECELENKSSDNPTEDEKPTWSYAGEKKLLKIKTQRIFKDQLLSEVKNQKYVLISDEAGNGKSWTMKNFTNILRKQNPTSWMTYVDLKQFIDEIKAQKNEPEFSSFLIEKILKIKLKFEAKIFKKMYKNGKVLILFDGFDEIAPNYAEFVSKLAQNFQQNGGNQLWIATRDYFEVDLQKKLKLDVAYRLEEMDEDEGVDLIIKSWILMDLKDESEPKSKEEFEMFLEMSPKYESYRQKAYHIIRKALVSRNNSVGLPQFYKMIADGFKDVSDVSNLQGLKIYAEFIDILYKRWCKKGQIREEANVKCQHFVLNFHKFHQYQAILSLFPELAPILFPGYNGSEWPEEEVIACGILTKINGKYYFIHETFREYHVADAIANALKNDEVAEKVLETLDEVLTEDKFEIIRKFLFPVLNEPSILEKVKPLIEKAVFCERYFGVFFTDNLENLADLAIKVLKNGNYDEAIAVLNENAWNIARSTQNSKLFLKFQDFIINFSKVEDLKELIILNEIFQDIISSSLEIEIFEEFVIKTESKTDREFIRQGLMLEGNGSYKGNIFYFLSTSSNLNAHKVNKFLKIMEKFLTSADIFELMSKCDGNEQNILQVCVKSEKEENLKIFWTEIEIFLVKQNFPQNFKEFVKQCEEWSQNGNILDSAVRCNNIEVHEALWELLLKTFENREELKDLILRKHHWRDNFLHNLVEGKNPAIIDLTFKKLKENFSEVQLKEILTLKDSMEMNLLQFAACLSNIIEVHQCLWKFFRDFCGTDENFLEMLKEVDGYRRNILHSVAVNSSGEVFEFMIQKLEKITSRDEIRKMLRNLNNEIQNLLQTASRHNKSSELHKTLWKALRKYLEKSEIVEFIRHVDENGNNLLHIAVEENTEEIVELTWNEIKSFLNHDEQVEYLKLKGEAGKNLIEISLESNYYDREEVIAWVKTQLENYKINL